MTLRSIVELQRIRDDVANCEALSINTRKTLVLLLDEGLIEGVTITDYFGITPTERRQFANEQKNRWLREAAENVDASERCRVTAMRKAIKLFEKHIWPNSCDEITPPADYSRLNRCLWRARKFGKIELGERQIYRILT